MNVVLKISNTFIDLSKYARVDCVQKLKYDCLVAETINGDAIIAGVFHKTKSPYDFCIALFSCLRTGGKVFDADEWLYAKLSKDFLAALKEEANEVPKP